MHETSGSSAATVALCEREANRIVMLRLRAPSADAIKAFEALLALPLPTIPNRAIGSHCRAVWMGPDEWMLVEPPVSCEAMEAIPGCAAILAVEVGDGRYALDVEGVDARNFLAKAMSIDLHPAVLPVDHSAMTLFAQIPVVVDHHQPNCYRLWFDVSFRAFVRAWCDEALVEFRTAGMAA